MAKKAQKQEVHKTKYRDRAQERREDKNEDYKDVEEYEEVDIEKSKYLGGDVEHTHLVKGLDRALLNKRRGELEEGEDDRMEREYQDTKKKKEMEAAAKSAKTSMVFVSNIGRRIYHYAVENPLKTRSNIETFLPGRMMFEFDVDENFGSSLPTTLMQSRADCPDTEDRLSGQVTGDIARKLTRIMSLLTHGSKYGRKGRKRKKKRKKTFDDDEDEDEGPSPLKATQSQRESDGDSDDNGNNSDDNDDNDDAKPLPPPMSDDDEDIFGDAGRDYECEDQDAEDAAAGEEKAVYFEKNAKDDLALKAPKNEDMEKAVRALTAEKSEQMKDERQKEKKKKVTAKAQDPNFVDTYMECYPASYGGSGTSSGFVVDDNSDEEDLSKMDQGRSKARPWDFGSEQEWGKFNDEREANPKAAFQFGLKMKDGRVTNKVKSAKEKAKSKEQKFERDFNKIENMMKKRGADKAGKKNKARSDKRQRILSGFKK